MKKQYTTEELTYKAASYCSITEHCIADVEAKLKVWSVENNDRDKIIKYLIDNDFINEKRYCRAFVKDKFRFNKWGKIKITMALREKRINAELIHRSLSIIDEGEYEATLSELLKNKLQNIKYTYEYEKQGKLFRFAQGRGFENDLITRVLRGI